MATDKQISGEFGEKLVAAKCACPKCKRPRSLKRLPNNFKCADLICDFRGFLAQVKAATVKDVTVPPDSMLGAAWGPQKDRMDAAIYLPLFIVTMAKVRLSYAIFYLSADLQDPGIFEPRAALSETARRAGWQGFVYRLAHIRERLVRLA